MKFKLNTQHGSNGRIRGLGAPSPLDREVEFVLNYRKDLVGELSAAINKVLPAAQEKLEFETSSLRRQQRGTRSAYRIAARYERAYRKVRCLTEALERLSK